MPNRYLCDVLAEMRKAYKTRNFSYLPGLIEEAQTMGNRMESAIGDAKSIATLEQKRHDLKHEVKQLEDIKEAILVTIGVDRKDIRSHEWSDSKPLAEIIQAILAEGE